MRQEDEQKELTPEERKRKMMLLAKDYPIRIRTSGGKFFMPIQTFERDEYGMPCNMRFCYASFETLADAIECGIKWKEAVYNKNIPI